MLGVRSNMMFVVRYKLGGGYSKVEKPNKIEFTSRRGKLEHDNQKISADVINGNPLYQGLGAEVRGGMFTEGQVPNVKNARHCLSRQAAARIRPRLREARIV